MHMNTVCSSSDDLEGWLALAREVEPLFGPMVHDPAFREALRQAIANRHAFCIRSGPESPHPSLKGGVIISPDTNEIAWLAVASHERGQGFGWHLLEVAIGQLDPRKSIRVQTFAESVPEGRAARRLYSRLGFVHHQDGGLNPAGVPTAILQRRPRPRFHAPAR